MRIDDEANFRYHVVAFDFRNILEKTWLNNY